MKIRMIVLCLLFAAAAAGPAHAQTGVARVNGVVIPQARMELFVKDLTREGRPDTAELRSAIREELINRELLAQEAVRRGLDKRAETLTRLDIARMNVLAQTYLQEVARTTPTGDDVLRKEYERIKAQVGTKEYKARHILVEKEEEAKEIIAQLRRGASFEKLAAERSRDSGTKAAGGELDWSPAGRYVKPFGDALAKLAKGQLTATPIHTNFGWHVIRLDDVREVKFPSFDEVKGNLQQQLQRQAQEKALAELRAKAKIE